MSAISVLIVLAAYAYGVSRVWRRAGRGQGIGARQAIGFGVGSLALLVAFSPWMHDLSERRLFAHMLQHELLMVVAAPCLAWGAPVIALLWALPRSARRRVGSWLPEIDSPQWRLLTAPPTVFALYAAALWLWHVPAAYAFAIEHNWVHLLEHACFLFAACLFWWGIAYGTHGRARYGAAVVYVFATAIHGGLLGALLTISPRVWYQPYMQQGTPGLSALEDQQLAGLLMWIPASMGFVAGGLMLFAAWLIHSDRATRFPSVARLESPR
ncbi:MAG: cytochrome c oxidase assembly protein [Vicinamibacterales bacterium]